MPDKKKIIYIESDVHTGATSFACEYLRNFQLEKLTEVHVSPHEHDDVIISFFFQKNPNSDLFMQINVYGGFCVGYRGEGPWGLHDLMVDAGFSKDVAKRVFEVSRHEYSEFKK